MSLTLTNMFMSPTATALCGGAVPRRSFTCRLCRAAALLAAADVRRILTRKRNIGSQKGDHTANKEGRLFWGSDDKCPCVSVRSDTFSTTKTRKESAGRMYFFASGGCANIRIAASTPGVSANTKTFFQNCLREF